MSEENPSEFQTVDRRSSADTESAPPDATPEESPETATQEALDPAIFLSYAAMQMDTHALMSVLAAIFDGHAWRNLGMMADPRTGTLTTDLPAAQHAIDGVQFFLSKTENQLSPEERREAHRRLNDLRVNYLSRLNSSR